MKDQTHLRKNLAELLNGGSAHIDFEKSIKGFPLERINTRVKGSPHTPWEQLEHIRIAASDILEFSRDSHHTSPSWPEGYWPRNDADENDWNSSVTEINQDLRAMIDLVMNEETDLFAKIEGGNGQTLLREALLVADHNAYHLGQLVLLRRIFESEDFQT